MDCELISRKALLEDMKRELKKASEANLTKDETKVIMTSAIALKDFVTRQPTVDAAPVVHGEWIWWPDNDGCDYECSNPKCRCRISYNGSKVSGDFNYCPNCGAKMDGGDKE